MTQHGIRPSTKARLLLVEDSRGEGEYIRGLLERLGYEVVWARSGTDALKLARIGKPDLIILDVVMEGMDGLAVCRWLKTSDDTKDVPVIMLTVKSEVHERVEGLHVGANDYLPKPFADAELEARVSACLRVRAAETELKRRNAQLESMLHHVEGLAMTDALTGLFNRRRFGDGLRREVAAAKRYGHLLSCIMVDVDHFKRINDEHGHDTGDRVLTEIARRIQSTLREVDLAARYGGEEFAIVLPHTDRTGALVVAERIGSTMRAKPITVEAASIPVTVSQGVATSEDVRSLDGDLIVKAADSALYVAKATGRDRVAMYSKETDPPSD